MAGLPKKYAKMGFKKGWAAYKRDKGSSRRKRNPSKPRSGGGRVAKKRGFLSLNTIYRFARLGAFAAPGVVEAISTHSTQGKIQNIIRMYSGFDVPSGSWNWRSMLQGWMPFVGVSLVTYGLPKLLSMIRRL